MTVHEKMRNQLLQMMEELNEITDKDCKKLSANDAKDKVERARAMIDVAKSLTEIDRVEIEEKRQTINAVNSMTLMKKAGIDPKIILTGKIGLLDAQEIL